MKNPLSPPPPYYYYYYYFFFVLIFYNLIPLGVKIPRVKRKEKSYYYIIIIIIIVTDVLNAKLFYSQSVAEWQFVN